MFESKNYAQASVAYLNVWRDREAAICDAYHMREKARSTSTTASVARTRAFITAANAFIACTRDSPSKQVKERLAHYSAAGECYLEASDTKKAGECYRMAEQYVVAAHSYRQGGYFDEMVEVITQHEGAFESDLLEHLKRVAQMHYFKVNPNARLVSKYLIFYRAASKRQVSTLFRFGWCSFLRLEQDGSKIVPFRKGCARVLGRLRARRGTRQTVERAEQDS